MKGFTGTTQIKVQFEQDTVWLTQVKMQDLFQRSKATISEHITNIFKEGELEEEVVVRKSRTTTQHVAITGKEQSTPVNIYNLDVVISVGYRVKSKQGTQFRIWANSILKDYLIKGYAINEKCLAQKKQEVQILKNGIQTLSRAIEEKTADNNLEDGLESIFSPLSNSLYQIEALGKSKAKENWLRIYGLRVERNIYIIT